MSRIGKQPITIPSGVSLAPTEDQVEITGPKGTVSVPLFAGLELSVADGIATVACADKTRMSFYGLQRTLIQNGVTGVSAGWTKDLELHGVGMRAAMAGTGLRLSLGFSHPVDVEAPEGIAFQVNKNVVTVSGISKQLVGEVAAKIRKIRQPEPYKGKGIRYSNEYIRRKAGKTGKAK